MSVETRFSRSVLIKGYDLEKISKIKTCIVGVGALGSWVADAIEKFGVNKIVLIDPDTVEESNLARQQYTNDDVGENKAFAKKRHIENCILPNSTIVEASEEYINKDNVEFEIPDDTDIVFLCVDNAETRLIINDYLVEKRIPFINGGTTEGHAGEVCFVQPGKTPCLRCFFPKVTKNGNCSENPDPSIVGNSMLIAANMVFQFQQWATGRETIGPVLKFDGDRKEPKNKMFKVGNAIELGKDIKKVDDNAEKIPAPFYYLERDFKTGCICERARTR